MFLMLVCPLPEIDRSKHSDNVFFGRLVNGKNAESSKFANEGHKV